MKRDEVTGSKNYNADDLANGDITVTVADVTLEEFKQEDGYKQKKLVVSFRGKDKRLVCGKTKAEALFDMLGDDTDEWVGQRIRRTLGKTTYAGKRVNCVEVAEPLAARPAAKPNGKRTAEPADDDDDRAAPAPAPGKKQAASAVDPDDDGNPPY